MKRVIICFLLASVLPAAAQQPQQPPTPMEQAMSERLSFETNTALMLRSQVIAAQREAEGLKAHIKQLEDAAKPKDEPAK